MNRVSISFAKSPRGKGLAAAVAKRHAEFQRLPSAQHFRQLQAAMEDYQECYFASFTQSESTHGS
jgi:hypothetical protein